MLQNNRATLRISLHRRRSPGGGEEERSPSSKKITGARDFLGPLRKKEN